MSIDTLLCTVGTSFLGNIRSVPDKHELFVKLRIGRDDALNNVEWSQIKELGVCYKQGRWGKLGSLMAAAMPENAMICGAEINSIASLYKKGWLDLKQIVFLVSDTEDGLNMGKMLQSYYEARSKELVLKQVTYQKVERLQDENPREFKSRGLRNLVRTMGWEIQKAGGSSRVAINATGGYKAQIAIAVSIGQSLDIPVYYKHEKFNEIISFPPLPVTLDYDLIGRYGDILAVFERGEALTQEETGSIDEKLRALLEEIWEDDQVCWELSPIGQIYLTGFRLRHPLPLDMPPASEGQRKQPEIKGHHFPENFEEHVVKVWRGSGWITTCYNIDYGKQASLKRTGFYLDDIGSSCRVVGTYVDHTGFGARFVVLTTGKKRTDLVWAVDRLNQLYGS